MAAIEAQEFANTLAACLVEDNAVRQNAEYQFQAMKVAQPDAVVQLLLQVMSAHQRKSLRHLAAVLLRRALCHESESLYVRVKPETQTMIKEGLLAIVSVDLGDSTRRKTCDAIGELGMGLLGAHGQSAWPELLPWAVQSVQSESPRARLNGIHVLRFLSAFILEDLRHELDNVVGLLSGRLTDGDVSVREEALASLCQLLMALDLDDDVEKLTPVLPGMMRVVSEALSSGAEQVAADCLMSMAEVAENRPAFFKPSLANVVRALTAVLGTSHFEDNVRHAALELLVTLAESDGLMCRKLPGKEYSAVVLPAVLAFAEDVDEEPRWDTLHGVDDDDDTGNSETAIAALTRLAPPLGLSQHGRLVLSAAAAVRPGEGDWRRRYARVRAVETCSAHVEDRPAEYARLLQCVKPFLDDPHHRVVWAAVHVYGYMADELRPTLQERSPGEVLGDLLRVLRASRPPRVHSQAVYALSVMLEGCRAESIAPLARDLVGMLLTALDSPDHGMVQASLACTSSIADACQQGFAPFYAAFMPKLKALFRTGGSAESMQTRAMSLETMSIVGYSVGVEAFGADAQEIMRHSGELYQGGLTAGDPLRSYMLQAWGRIASVLRQAFVPYLPAVVPCLLDAMRQSVQTILPSDDDNEYEDDDDVQVLANQDGRVLVHTTAKQEKEAGCLAFGSVATAVGVAIKPYVREALALMGPIISSCIVDDIRAACMSYVSTLLEAAAAAVSTPAEQAEVAGMLEFTIANLTTAMDLEDDFKMAGFDAQTVKLCLDQACAIPHSDPPSYRALLPTAALAKTAESLLGVVARAVQARAVRAGQRHVSDYDEEELELDSERAVVEGRAMFSAVSALGAIARTHPAAYPELFAALWERRVRDMANPVCLPCDRRLAMYAASDLVEYCGAGAQPYLPEFVPMFVAGVQHEDVQLRQTSAYALGIAAQHGGAAARPLLAGALDTLAQATRIPLATRGDNLVATDNCYAAMLRIAVFALPAAQAETVVKPVLEQLPLRGDPDENPAVMDILCDQAAARSTAVLGSNGAHIPVLVRVFADALPLCGKNVRVQRRMVELVMQIQAQSPPALRSAVQARLSDRHRAVLGEAIEALRRAGGASPQASPQRSAVPASSP